MTQKNAPIVLPKHPTLGAQVRTIINKRGWNQYQLAYVAGVRQSMISRLKTDTRLSCDYEIGKKIEYVFLNPHLIPPNVFWRKVEGLDSKKAKQ